TASSSGVRNGGAPGQGRWRRLARRGRASARTAATQRPVEVEGGADECQVGERLREVAERLAAAAGLFAVEPKVVGVADHLLEQQPGIFQACGVGAAGACKRLDQPEGAHVEGSLLTREAVRRGGGIVAIDQAVGQEAALVQGLAYRIDGRK